MEKKNKEIKGIKLSDLNLNESIVTTEDSVLKFFETRPKEAFSIQILREAGFSSNIRKIIQKLIDQDKIIQLSHKGDDKTKWEYLYYLKPQKSVFDLKKTEDGWEVIKITINGFWFKVECKYDTEPNNYSFRNGVVVISLGFPTNGDAVIYYDAMEESTNLSWEASVRFSEIQENYNNLQKLIHICQEYETLWDFDVIFQGKRSRVSKSVSTIEGEKIVLWAGNIGFLFITNSKDQTISIYPRYRELDTEGNVLDKEDINYFDINYGYDYDDEDFGEESFDFVAIGDLDENYEADFVKKEVKFILLRGKR